MSNATSKSFIDAVITNMSSQKSQFGAIARRVQSQRHDNVLNRIAMAYVALQNDRSQARVAGNIRAMAGEDSPERGDAGAARNPVVVKPELLFNFLQNVMNSVCWHARRLMREQENAAAGDQANGLDFSQNLAEQLNVEGVPTDRIGELVADDHFALGNVHSWLLGKMNYLTEVEELRVFADYRPPAEGMEVGSGNWELRHAADTFDEALGVMDTIIAELGEEEAQKSGQEAATIDFGAAA